MEIVEAVGWFAFGAMSWWFLIVIEIGIMFYCVHVREALVGLIGFVIFILITSTIGDFALWSYIVEEPWRLLGVVSLFVGAGVIWSFFKWDRWRSALAARVTEQIAVADKDIIEYEGSEHKEDWGTNPRNERKSIVSSYESNKLARNNKSMICTWILYWPCSVVWTFLQDIILEGIENLFELLKGVYDKIGERHDKKVAGLFKNPPASSTSKDSTEA